LKFTGQQPARCMVAESRSFQGKCVVIARSTEIGDAVARLAL